MSERFKLREARIEIGLSQVDLARKIGYSREAVGAWERGDKDPYAEAIEALCLFFNKSPQELDLAKDLSEAEMNTIEEILRNRVMSRRQAERVLVLSGISALIKPLVSPPQFLSQCNTLTNGCYQLMRGDNLAIIGDMIGTYAPTLVVMATERGEFQQLAASIAVRVKILQIGLATHRRDFISRQLLCREAVELAELSADSGAIADALYWEADTHVYCLPAPTKAIPLLEKALARDAVRADGSWSFYSNLAIAYAQDGNRVMAMRNMDKAEIAIDMESAQNIELRRSLGNDRGRMFLALERKSSNKGFARLAYSTFNQALQQGSWELHYRSQYLIHQADAARGMGDMGEFVRCLAEGKRIAVQIESQKNVDDARALLGKGLTLWGKEPKVQELAQAF